MKFLYAWLVLMVVGSAVIIPVVLHQEAQWDRRCEAHGGHVKDIGRNKLCLTPDGRVLQ